MTDLCTMSLVIFVDYLKLCDRLTNSHNNFLAAAEAACTQETHTFWTAFRHVQTEYPYAQDSRLEIISKFT